MKPRFYVFPLFLVFVAAIMIFSLGMAHADPLQWQVPYVGTVNLNLNTTEALAGYDGILKQAVGGLSLPVWTDPKSIVSLQLGAVAPWPNNNSSTIEPYVALGHDILREIPSLKEYTSCHVNVFGRYATNVGKAGAGISFSYAFAGGETYPTEASAP